ncbi:guanylate kinase [Patescibacteria group bacterium]|nr:guanylate kinase [Patescibacteria group bacterium]
MKGKLILVVGPTGSGKGTLLSYLRETEGSSYVFPISCTTRAPRPGEKDGETYYFLTKEEFEKREAQGDFLEWAAYGSNYYGTLKSEILPFIEQGKTVIREVEVQGARQIQTLISKDDLQIIFIDAGEWADLERRILARASMSEVELLARRKRYEDELTFKGEAARVVVNPDGGLEQAKIDFINAVHELAAQ